VCVCVCVCVWLGEWRAPLVLCMQGRSLCALARCIASASSQLPCFLPSGRLVANWPVYHATGVSRACRHKLTPQDYEDTVTFEFRLAEGACPPLVLALGQPRAVKRLVADCTDLARYANKRVATASVSVHAGCFCMRLLCSCRAFGNV
jgi:hypothetical protein